MRTLIAGLIAGALVAAGPVAALAQSGPAASDDDLPVIIYSHGTTRPQRVEDCNAPGNAVPPSVKRLEEAGVARIMYLCSRATDGGEAGSYIYKRAADIGRLVETLHAQGVETRRIFLAGHSAGAWSSLMYLREHADQVNAAILFAPECCGPRFEAEIYPVWRSTIRPRQVAEIVSGKKISAVVFAYPDDPFSRPEDLAFLTEAYPESVRIVPVACGNGHLTHLNDCQSDETAAIIERYVKERLTAAQ